MISVRAINYFNNLVGSRGPFFDRFCYMESDCQNLLVPKTEKLIDLIWKKTGCSQNFFPSLLKSSLDPSIHFLNCVGRVLCYNSSVRLYIQRSVALFDVAVKFQNFFMFFLNPGIGPKMVLFDIFLHTLDQILSRDLKVILQEASYYDSTVYALGWMVGYQLYAEAWITAKDLVNDVNDIINFDYNSIEINEFSNKLSNILYRLSYLLLMAFPSARSEFLLSKMIEWAFCGRVMRFSFGVGVFSSSLLGLKKCSNEGFKPVTIFKDVSSFISDIISSYMEIMSLLTEKLRK